MREDIANPAASLSLEQQTMQALLSVLQREQLLLAEANATGVMALLDEKSRLVAQASELAINRHRALAAAGFEASETGMSAWLSSAQAGSHTARRWWTRLLEITREAKEVNRVNGVLMNQQMARNEAALNVLRGTDQSKNLYGPDGHTAAQTFSRGRIIG